MSRLRKLLSAWLAPDTEPDPDAEPPSEERELVRRTPATPRRELAVAVMLAAAAVRFTMALMARSVRLPLCWARNTDTDRRVPSAASARATSIRWRFGLRGRPPGHNSEHLE